MGCARRAHVLLGRQSGRRLAASPARCGGARLAAPLELDEHSHAGMAAAYCAGAARSALRRAARLRRHGPGRRATAASRSVSLPVHRRGARDRAGAQSRRHDPARAARGPKGQRRDQRHRRRAARSGARGAEAARVTVEEIVDALPPAHERRRAAALARGSAWCIVRAAPIRRMRMGYYARDNAFYQRWDDIARDRDGFLRLDGHGTCWAARDHRRVPRQSLRGGARERLHAATR